MAWQRNVEPVDVLVVCTGNLCRSPIIETMLRAKAPELSVISRGTHAPRGGPSWHPWAIEVLDELGYKATGTAQRLRAADVKAASLILTAEGMHRGVVVRHDPTAAERTYTLLEAARLLRRAPVPPGFGIPKLIEHLDISLKAYPMEHNDDLADPIFGTLNDFRWCREVVEDCLEVIVPAISPLAL